MIPLLREIRDPIIRDTYLQTLGHRTGVEERVLLEALRAPVDGGPAGPRGGAGEPAFTADAVMSAPDTIDTKAELKSLTLEEARLLRLLLLVPEQQERVADTLAGAERAAPQHAGARAAGGDARRSRTRPRGRRHGAVRADAVPRRRCRPSFMGWRSRCTRNAARTRMNSRATACV